MTNPSILNIAPLKTEKGFVVIRSRAHHASFLKKDIRGGLTYGEIKLNTQQHR